MRAFPVEDADEMGGRETQRKAIHNQDPDQRRSPDGVAGVGPKGQHPSCQAPVESMGEEAGSRLGSGGHLVAHTLPLAGNRACDPSPVGQRPGHDPGLADVPSEEKEEEACYDQPCLEGHRDRRLRRKQDPRSGGQRLERTSTSLPGDGERHVGRGREKGVGQDKRERKHAQDVEPGQDGSKRRLSRSMERRACRARPGREIHSCHHLDSALLLPLCLGIEKRTARTCKGSSYYALLGPDVRGKEVCLVQRPCRVGGNPPWRRGRHKSVSQPYHPKAQGHCKRPENVADSDPGERRRTRLDHHLSSLHDPMY